MGLDAVHRGRVRIVPERFVKVWDNWLENIKPWCISRQLWWGHRIPAWYCPDGHVTVSADPNGPDACELCGRPAAELVQDPDIFDTWYSSGLWPFSTLGWPDGTDDLARYYPGTVMETGYDILFFWVARMMMLGIQLTEEAPFEVVYLSGLVRDPYGQKMSKTKGNVVDPLQTIDEYGADALRFALIHGTAPGADTRLGPAKLENARNFANKLWNAARFVLGARPTTIPADAERRLPGIEHLGPADRWILSRLAAATESVDRHLSDFAFGEVTKDLYEAIWSEYCDWYLEIAKVRLADPSLDPADREATWWTLVEVLDAYLRLLHPVMPFVTEAIWDQIPHRAKDPDLLIVARWPAPSARAMEVEAEVGTFLELITGVRNARAEARIEPSARVPLDVHVPEELGPTFEALRPAIGRLAKADPIRRRLTASDLDAARQGGGLTILAGPVEAVVGRPEVDATAAALERERLSRELAELERRLDGVRARLRNPGFVGKAPPAVVDGARGLEAELGEQVEKVRARLAGG
ncbi:MAG TPA: class I tRNA ligase family protein [Candidatus Limnocylindrales bacterium]|nr:class I tRNA ligase family protein [Candidatus Limnocylindrales bacterium]